MSTATPTIDTALREAIIAAGKSGRTSYQLAQASGVSASAIGRFLSGERGLSLESAAKIAESLGLVLVAATEKKSRNKS